MLILGILLLLLSASTVVTYLRIKGVRLAYVWLILIFTVLLCLIILLIIQPENISPLSVQNWFNINNSPVYLKFYMTGSNWPISIAYFSFLLSYLLTSIIHLKGHKSLIDWLELILLFSTGWIFLLAGDYWSILIGWTLIDFVELIFHFRHKSLSPVRFLFHFSTKFIGSLLLVFVTSRVYQTNPIKLFENSPQGSGMILLLAAFLHSGVVSHLSNNAPKGDVPKNTNITFMKIVIFISSFFILAYVPNPNLNVFTSYALRVLLFIYGLVELYRWASNDNVVPPIEGVFIGFSALICLVYLSGSGGVIISSWLIVMLFPIGWLYLFTYRDSKLNISLFLFLLFISGFPLSLTFPAFNDLLIGKKWTDVFFMSMLSALLISGHLHHGLKKAGNIEGQEPWFQTIYLVGLYLPVIPLTFIGLKIIEARVRSPGAWVIGPAITIIAILLYATQFRPEKRQKRLLTYQQIIFNWGFRVLSGFQLIYKVSSSILNNSMVFISNLFEGDGGILWSIVFLALFLTILKFQGNP